MKVVLQETLSSIDGTPQSGVVGVLIPVGTVCDFSLQRTPLPQGV
ncbi:hypothetical protein U8335_06830 [Roseiconus lacunae]|nr:hypothetical protein U8335_06830 [Stieleria sp. HD01]